jgi:hypothetical protein
VVHQDESASRDASEFKGMQNGRAGIRQFVIRQAGDLAKSGGRIGESTCLRATQGRLLIPREASCAAQVGTSRHVHALARVSFEHTQLIPPQ